MDPLENMARHCMGYGHWGAPYWFIGLEEGMSGTLQLRIDAFQKLNNDGLCDCKEFHHEIGVPKHHQQGSPVEATWRALMLVLLTYKGLKPDLEGLREYQIAELGRRHGETVLTELFGLPAANVIEGAAQRKLHFTEKTLDDIRTERINTIRQKIQQHRPSLVVMYGTSKEPKKQFARLAGRKMATWDLFLEGKTLFTLMPHPTSHGRTNEEWVQHAERLRKYASPRHADIGL